MTDPLGLLPDDEQDPLGLIKPSKKAAPIPVRSEAEIVSEMYAPLGETPTYDNGEAMEAFKGIFKTAPLDIASGILGFVSMIDDNASGLPREKRYLSIGKYTKEAGDYLSDWRDRVAPKLGAGTPEYYFYSALSSALTNLPSLAAGFATGSEALALIGMGAQVAGNKYLERLEKGDTQDKASIVSGLYGVSEIVGEKIPLGFLMKNKGLKAILLSALTEVPGELGTEILEIAIDEGIVGEKSTWAEFVNRLRDVAITTAISAPVTASIGRGMGNVIESKQGKEKAAPKPITKIVTEDEAIKPGAADTLPVTFEKKDGKVVAKVGEDVVGSWDGKELKISDKYEGNRLEIASGLFVEQKRSLDITGGDILTVDVNNPSLTVSELQEIRGKLEIELKNELSQVEEEPPGIEQQEKLSKEWIQENFRGQVTEETPEGFKVQLENGSVVTVNQVGDIAINREQAKAEGYTQYQIEHGVALGSTTIIDNNALIQLVDEGTELPHEVFHTARDLVLNDQEIGALDKETPDIHEQADNYLAYKNVKAEDRAAHPIFQKIMDFFSRIRDALRSRPTARSVYGAIERGDVWSREARAGINKEEYAIRNKQQIKEDKKWRNWEPTITSTGKIKGAPEWVIDRKTLNKMRAGLRKFAQEGIIGRYWYEESARAVMRMVENDIVKAEKFIQLLAIYSPNSNIWFNTIQAVKAYTHWQNGGTAEDFKVGSEKTDAKAVAMLYRGESWEGRKTNSFYENLMHELVVNYPTEIGKLNLDKKFLSELSAPATIDVWMYRAFGYETERAPGDKGTGKYSFSENEIKRLTAEINEGMGLDDERWSPHQVQASIWTALKSRYEMQDVKDKTNRKSLQEHIIHKEGKEIIYPPKNTDASRMHLANWRHFALQTTSDMVTQAANANARSFANDLERMTEVVTWEANPSTSLGYEINNASPEVMRDFTSEAQALLVDESGNDALAAKVGVALSYSTEGFGAYAGEVSSNRLAHILPARTSGQTGFNTEEVRAYARAIQYIFRQDAVPWFRPDNKPITSKKGLEDQKFRVINSKTGRLVPNGRFDTQGEAEEFAKQKGDGFEVRGGDLAIGIVVRFTNPLKYDTLKNVLSNLQGYLGEDTGFTRTAENEITIVNFRDDDTKVPYKNDEQFLDEVGRFVEDKSQELGVSQHLAILSQGEYGYVHNWAEDNEGKQILDTDGLSGRPDLHPWLRDRRNAFDQLLERYSGEGLKTAEQSARGRTSYSIRSIRGSDLKVEQRYGIPKEGASSVLAVHYSRSQRLTLTGAHHGKGLQGAERVRLADAPPEIKHRIYFYVDTGEGIRPERGLGQNITAVHLDNLYDTTKDPAGIVAKVTTELGRDPKGYWFNKVEQSVMEKGYDGIYVPEAQSNQGVVVLIGPQHDQVPVAQIAQPEYSIKSQFREATGQTPGPKTVREMDALRSGMTKAERAARGAFKQGVATGKVLALQTRVQTVKARIRAITGQTRIDNMVPEMDALDAAMEMAEKTSMAAYRAGDQAGAEREEQRLKMIQEIKKNKMAVQKEARNGFRWLDSLEKKLDKKIIDVEYKDAIRAVINYNGDALEAFITKMEAEGDQLYIDPEAIESLKQTNRDNLSLDELRNQISLAKTLSFQGRAKRLIGELNQRVGIVEAVEGMVEEIKETFELDLDKSLPLTPSSRKKGRWETIKDTLDGLHNVLVKAEYIFDKAAGYRKDSVIRKHTFERMAQAENKATSRGIEIGKELRTAFDFIKDNIKGIMTEQVLEVGGRQLTKEEVMMVALNAENEGNRDRLRKGYQWTDKQIDAIVDSLKPNEKAFVNAIFDIVNKQGGELSEVFKQLTGERMKFVAGRYFPIVTDKELSERAASQEADKDLFQQIFHQATVSRGFTKTRVGGMDAPLLSFDVIPKHLRDTNQFISHAVPVRDVNRVLNNPDFKAAMIGSVGNNAYNQLKPWLKAIANPYHEALATWDRIAGKLRSNAAITILGWSLSTAILQPSAYFQTINRIGFANAYRGFVDFYKNYGENKELMYALSPALLMRTQTFDADLKSLMDSDTSSMWKTNHMKESFYALMSWTDKMVTLPTWWAAYNEEMKNTQDQEKAVAYADKIVRNTQSSGQMKDLAEVQRGNNTRKLFVMFYSYFSSTYNEMSKSVEMVKTGQAGFSELMKSSWWLILLPSLLSTLLRKREETDPWELVKGTVGYGSAAIPVVGSVVNSLLENYEFKPTPVASLPTELMRFFHSKDTTKILKHGTMATGYLFGLPTRQVVLTGQFLMDAFEGEIEPENLIYAKQKGGSK
jgi:hypothetical protein